MEIIIYAITDNGNGRVTKLGTLKDLEDLVDLEIIVGMFSKDVVISFEVI